MRSHLTSGEMASRRSGCQSQVVYARILAYPIVQFGGGRAELNGYEIWKILYDHDVDLILTGHDHIYERFAPQTADGIPDPLRGIRQFVVGTGGSNHTSLASIANNSEVRNTDTFGVLKLTLRLTGYDWQFVPEAGKTFSDSGTQECHGSGPPPVPLTATPRPTPTIIPTPTGADLQVMIGGDNQGDEWIFNGQTRKLNYPNVNKGPVNIISATMSCRSGQSAWSIR